MKSINYKIEWPDKGRLMHKTFISLLIVFSFCAFAQDKTENTDLRAKKEIFSIKELGKNFEHYTLESSISGQFNISILKKEKLIDTKKIDTKFARSMDDEFVDKFISMKYIMKKQRKKDCKDTFLLSLRGEIQKICSSEKEKIDVLRVFIEKFKNHFS